MIEHLWKLLTPIKSIGLSSKNVKAPPAGPKARLEFIRLGITKGSVFFTEHGDRVDVKRVASDSTWADIRVIQEGGASWTKRQPLPFPESWVRVS